MAGADMLSPHLGTFLRQRAGSLIIIQLHHMHRTLARVPDVSCQVQQGRRSRPQLGRPVQHLPVCML